MRIESVHASPEHSFHKPAQESVRLLAGLGVEGDVHCGAQVRHRSRVAQDPSQPNLRQVHIISRELLEGLGAQGFALEPGDLGENLATLGLDLHALPVGAILRLGERALVALTGLRNPCAQLEAFQPGLLAAVLPRDSAGRPQRRAGVMAVVIAGGEVRPGDAVEVALPPGPAIALERV